jgi:hypothetical protein
MTQKKISSKWFAIFTGLFADIHRTKWHGRALGRCTTSDDLCRNVVGCITAVNDLQPKSPRHWV